MSTFAKTLLTVSLIIINRQQEHDLLIEREVIDDVYDYIIVGAGTAGSVVASRLSQNANLKILLVEAGSGETVESDMPYMTKSLWGSEMDWNFKISSQTNSFMGYNENLGHYSQGKVMGGSSTINAMAYVRGLPRDFDNWYKSFRVQGWSWDEVMPYFIKSENNTDPAMNGSSFHGTDGYLTVSTAEKPRLIHKTMIRAAQELGFSEIDLNDPKKAVGVAVQQMNMRDGSRCSAAKAFLSAAKNRTNLHIWAKAMVTKINFDDNKRAVSVSIQKDGKTSIVKTRNEIILSAGTINSAKLLMISGIGPKDHLQELKIPVIADLPVGHNFHDNPITFGVHFTINTTKNAIEVLEKDITEFFLNGSGLLTQFEKSVLRLSTERIVDKSWPDLQIFVDIGSLADFENSVIAEKALNLKPDIWEKFYKPYSGQSTLTFIPLLNRPESRGRIKLKSNDMKDEPIVDPNYFSINSDLKTLVEGMKIAYSLGQSKAFTHTFETKPFETRVPNCPSFASKAIPSDEYLECVAKTLTNTYTHSAGSVKMGSINDTKSVVSSELKVHGICGLRVIDASVVPQSPSGALFAAALMIGERGVDFVLKDYYLNSELNSSKSCYSLSNIYEYKVLMFFISFLSLMFSKKWN